MPRQKTIDQQAAELEADLQSVINLWEKRGRKAHKKFKRVQKGFKKAHKDYKIAKAEGRDPVTLTKHFAGQVRQFVRPNKSIYKLPKKGIGSKFKGILKKKNKGIY